MTLLSGITVEYWNSDIKYDKAARKLAMARTIDMQLYRLAVTKMKITQPGQL
jgi:hypothetical protein